MIPNTKAYIELRARSQEFLDFVVLACTAVPAVKAQLLSSGTAGLAPDYFKGTPNSAQLLAYAASYQTPLAAVSVITLFSYFEGYVMAVMKEIIDFHGGEKAFQTTADRRAKAFLTLASPTIENSKKKLQEPAKPKNKGRYQKYSKILASSGYRFPSELMAPYGVRNLIKKAKPRGAKAHEIPDLLRDALCFPLGASDNKRIEAIRDLRNKIAHGGIPPVPLKESMAVGRDLRTVAARIDQHVVEHFFVLEAYA